jgi:HK97 gp10 family phage protein
MSVDKRWKSSKIGAQLIGVNALKTALDKLDADARGKAAQIIRYHALNIQNDAKRLAPVDMGLLRASIKPRFYKSGTISEISTDTGYAAFIEFGTGPKGKQKHALGGPIPPEYQHGTGRDKPGKALVLAILEWMKRKGIRPKVSGRGKKKKAAELSLAYVIARHIARFGTAPRPFMFPAFEKVRPEFERDMQTFLRGLV